MAGPALRETPFFWWYLRAVLSGRRPGVISRDLRPRQVPPSLIREAYLRGPHNTRDLGSVAPGDWDREVIAFEDLWVVQAFRRHFGDGVPWNDLPWVRAMRDRLRAGGAVEELPTSWQYWRLRDEEDLDHRLEAYDLLFASIETVRYREGAGCRGPEARASGAARRDLGPRCPRRATAVPGRPPPPGDREDPRA